MNNKNLLYIERKGHLLTPTWRIRDSVRRAMCGEIRRPTRATLRLRMCHDASRAGRRRRVRLVARHAAHRVSQSGPLLEHFKALSHPLYEKSTILMDIRVLVLYSYNGIWFRVRFTFEILIADWTRTRATWSACSAPRRRPSCLCRGRRAAARRQEVAWNSRRERCAPRRTLSAAVLAIEVLNTNTGRYRYVGPGLDPGPGISSAFVFGPSSTRSCTSWTSTSCVDSGGSVEFDCESSSANADCRLAGTRRCESDLSCFQNRNRNLFLLKK